MADTNAQIDIDIESTLMGIGLGVAGQDILMNALFASTSVLVAGLGVAALGLAIKYMRNSEPGEE